MGQITLIQVRKYWVKDSFELEKLSRGKSILPGSVWHKKYEVVCMAKKIKSRKKFSFPCEMFIYDLILRMQIISIKKKTTHAQNLRLL